ncbi:hypothetical protein, partial [Paraburkholderia aspalathi]|uniref:hypothetical protein n=1 Tax=Paraburkholderia aspalathi TaxID=1324617 RepID=UPI001BA99989
APSAFTQIARVNALSRTFTTPLSAASHKLSGLLYDEVISNCLSRNRDLCNKKDTKLLREMIVSGFLNTPKGKVTSSVSAFRILIGV